MASFRTIDPNIYLVNFKTTRRLPIKSEISDYTMYIDEDNDVWFSSDLEDSQKENTECYLPIWSYTEIVVFLSEVAKFHRLHFKYAYENLKYHVFTYETSDYENVAYSRNETYQEALIDCVKNWEFNQLFKNE